VELVKKDPSRMMKFDPIKNRLTISFEYGVEQIMTYIGEVYKISVVL
jgi:hypothetical protein